MCAMAGRSRKSQRKTSSATALSSRSAGRAKAVGQSPVGVSVRRSKKKPLAVAEAWLRPNERGAKGASPVTRSAARNAFLKRVVNMFTEIADNAPEAVIADALAEPTAIATAARALAQSVVVEQPLDDADRQIAAALAAGAQYSKS